MFTSFTISHIHESLIVAESNTEYITVIKSSKCHTQMYINITEC